MQGHTRAQCELHPLKHICNENTGAHFNRHSNSFKERPRSSRWNTSVKTGNKTDTLLIKFRSYIFKEVIVDSNVAIRDQKRFIAGNINHPIDRERSWVNPKRLATSDLFDGAIRKFLCEPIYRLKRWIAQVASAEYDLIIGWIRLAEMAEKIFV